MPEPTRTTGLLFTGGRWWLLAAGVLQLLVIVFSGWSAVGVILNLLVFGALFALVLRGSGRARLALIGLLSLELAFWFVGVLAGRANERSPLSGPLFVVGAVLVIATLVTPAVQALAPQAAEPEPDQPGPR